MKKLMGLLGIGGSALLLVSCNTNQNSTGPKNISLVTAHKTYYAKSNDHGKIVGTTEPNATIKLLDPKLNGTGKENWHAITKADSKGHFILKFYQGTNFTGSSKTKEKLVATKKGYKKTILNVTIGSYRGSSDSKNYSPDTDSNSASNFDSSSADNDTSFTPHNVTWQDTSWQGVSIYIDKIETSSSEVKVHFLIKNGDNSIFMNLSDSNIRTENSDNGNELTIDNDDSAIVANDISTNTVTYSLPDHINGNNLSSISVQFEGSIAGGEGHNFDTGQVSLND